MITQFFSRLLLFNFFSFFSFFLLVITIYNFTYIKRTKFKRQQVVVHVLVLVLHSNLLHLQRLSYEHLQ